VIFARFYGANLTFSGSTTRRLTARFQLYGWLNKWVGHDQNHSLLDDQKEGMRKPRRDSRQWLGACCLVLFLIEPFGLVGVFAKERFSAVDSQLIQWNSFGPKFNVKRMAFQSWVIPQKMRQDRCSVDFMRSNYEAIVCTYKNTRFDINSTFGIGTSGHFLFVQIFSHRFFINDKVVACLKSFVRKNHVSNPKINDARVFFANFFLSAQNVFEIKDRFREHFCFSQLNRPGNPGGYLV